MVIARTAVELAQIRKLLYAVRTRDFDQVRRICQKGIDGIVNFHEPTEGQTPLLTAVKSNDEIMIRFLLELGGHPDVTDFQRRTPLMRAAAHGHIESVRALLNANANPSIRDLQGEDVLFACLTDGTFRQQECFSILLATRTPDVNGATDAGKPLLVAACEGGAAMESMSMMLIEHGADVHAIDKQSGRTALHAACAAGSTKVARELLQRGANPNAFDAQQQTSVHAAVTSRVFELLPILSAYNARFDLADRALNTPVHLAAMLNQGQAIRFMVQRGGTTRMKNAEKHLPMKIAKLRKNKDARKSIRVVEKQQYNRKVLSPKSNPHRDYKLHLYDWLQERSARLLRRFHQVENPTTHRITSSDVRQILRDEGFTQITAEDLNELLIRHETDPDEIDYQTLLTGRLFVEKPFLLQAFVSKNKKKKKKTKKTRQQPAIPIATRDEGARTSKGRPPLIYVEKHQFVTDRNRFGRDRTPTHMLSDDSAYYIDQPDPLFVHLSNAVQRGDLHTLRDAFQSGVPVDLRDRYYKTPLMIAAATGDLETAQFLLRCGANVHLEDHFKWTALHHAAHSGQLSVVRALVDAGAKINHPSITSATPLSRAIESSALDIVTYLIQKRANVRHENLMQRNLLDLAADFASPQVFDAVRTAYERKASTKSQQRSQPRRKPSSTVKKTKKDEPSSVAIKPVKLTMSLPRRGSLLATEEHLKASTEAYESITYHPLGKWTDQPTTKELLEKKVDLRDRFTMSIDFPEHKRPLLANAEAKLERLDVQRRRARP